MANVYESLGRMTADLDVLRQEYMKLLQLLRQVQLDQTDVQSIRIGTDSWEIVAPESEAPAEGEPAVGGSEEHIDSNGSE